MDILANIHEAIKQAGGPSQVSEKLQVSQGTVSGWKKRGLPTTCWLHKAHPRYTPYADFLARHSKLKKDDFIKPSR